MEDNRNNTIRALNYLPKGVVWENFYKQSDDLYKMFSVFSKYYEETKEAVNKTFDFWDLDKINEQQIEIWESFLGIPNDIFRIEPSNLTLRKKAIQFMLTQLYDNTSNGIEAALRVLGIYIDNKLYDDIEGNSHVSVNIYLVDGLDDRQGALLKANLEYELSGASGSAIEFAKAIVRNYLEIILPAHLTYEVSYKGVVF